MFWKKTPIEIKPIEIKLSGDLTELLALFRVFLTNYLIGKDADLRKLRTEIMRPLIEQQWDKRNAEEAEKINQALKSKGEKIHRAWNKYKEELLELRRQKKDTQLVEAKLEILDILMEGVE